MELSIAGTSLTETHLLDIGNEDLYLVVGDLRHLVEQTFGFVVFHLHDMYESQIVECLCPTRMIICRQVIRLPGKMLRTVDVFVMIGIRKGIQLVHRLPIRM